jgi:hypothetical protein
MNKEKLYVVLGKAFTFFFATMLTILLLDNAGVDISKANILSFSDFSFAVILLWGVCLYSFENVIDKIRIFVISMFFKQEVSSNKKT